MAQQRATGMLEEVSSTLVELKNIAFFFQLTKQPVCWINSVGVVYHHACVVAQETK